MYKKVRSILNKLTPQKFQTLVKQVSEMEITTEERLKGVTDLIFEKVRILCLSKKTSRTLSKINDDSG